MPYILLIVTIVFATARFIVPVTGKINKSDIFKDMAHIWIGILIGIAWLVVLLRRVVEEAKRRSRLTGEQNWSWWVVTELLQYTNNAAWYVYLAVILTIIEVIAFLVRQ